MGRQWAKRETQILSVIESTVGLVGDLQAIAGKAMSEIPNLDMPLLGSSALPERKASDVRRPCSMRSPKRSLAGHNSTCSPSLPRPKFAPGFGRS
jgi:hypothetical protein